MIKILGAESPATQLVRPSHSMKWGYAPRALNPKYVLLAT